MPDFDPRRVPAETTELTYTGRGGEQVSIPITTTGKGRGAYAFAQPATKADAAALDRMGLTTVARKAAEATGDNDDDTPAAGDQEG